MDEIGIEAKRQWLESLDDEELQEVEEAVLGPDFWDKVDEAYERKRDDALIGWYD